MTDAPKKLRGFASMTPERRKEIAAKGGRGVPAEKRAFSNKEFASKMGKIGGLVAKPEQRSFSKDRKLAANAGRIGKRKVKDLTPQVDAMDIEALKEYSPQKD